MLASPEPGLVLDHYRLKEKLGEGGMGAVWLTEDTRLGRKVALKFLPLDAAHDPVRRQRFEQEARAVAALSHPGIAAIYELAEADGQTYIVFEYVPGTTLRNVVRPGGLSSGELLDIAVEVAAALAAAHGVGVVHRDLKPENVMRTPSGACKILDFGLARLPVSTTTPEAAETKSILTSPGMVVGTAPYMAPEQLEAKEVDFRCDIFAFGTLLYELAAGVHPFRAGSSASTLANILTVEPQPLAQRNRTLPAELERIVRKCLRKRREERYQSTLDLAVDLANLKRDSGERPSGVGAASALPSVAPEDSLLGKVFGAAGATPRRWWEMHQLFILFVFSPAVLYLGLRSSATISASMNAALASTWRGWQGALQAIFADASLSALWWNAGLGLFWTLVLLVLATAAIRMYFVCLAVFVPERLPMEVRRLQPVLWGGYVIVGFLLAILGVLVLRANEGLVLGTGVTALGLLTLMAAVNVEPVMVRAAFPEAFAEDRAQRERRSRIYRIAAVHIVYLLLLFLPVGVGNVPIESVMQGISLNPTRAQLAVFIYSLAMVGGGIALVTNALQIVKETDAGLRVLLRWFPAYLAIDLAGSGVWIWIALEGHIPAVVALGITALVLTLPFAQRRMAQQALAASSA